MCLSKSTVATGPEMVRSSNMLAFHKSFTFDRSGPLRQQQCKDSGVHHSVHFLWSLLENKVARKAATAGQLPRLRCLHIVPLTPQLEEAPPEASSSALSSGPVSQPSTVKSHTGSLPLFLSSTPPHTIPLLQHPTQQQLLDTARVSQSFS